MVESVFGESDGCLRTVCEFPGDLHGCRQHSVLFDAQRHQSDSLRFLSREGATSEEVVLRLGHPREKRPTHGCVVAGCHPEASVPVDDPRGARHDRHVGEDSSNQTRTDRGAVNGRDDGLRTFDDVSHEISGFSKHSSPEGVVGDHAFDQIEASASRERLAGTIQKNYGIARDEADRQVKDWEKSRDKAADSLI